MIPLNSVLILEGIYSKRAKGNYALSMQWRPIQTVNLTGIKTNKEFERFWFDVVQRNGIFLLSSKFSYGKNKIQNKQVAKIKVTGKSIEHLDKRRLLPRLFERNEEILELESLYDEE